MPLIVVPDPPLGPPGRVGSQPTPAIENVHRSVRRWVSQALGDLTVSGDPWTVVLEERSIPDETRPVAVVVCVGPSQTEFARRSVPQGTIIRRQTVVATAFPELCETARESGMRARRVSERLLQAVEIGLVESQPVTLNGVDTVIETPIGGPLCVPLYDFSLVSEDLRDRESGPLASYGFMDVLDHSVDLIADPDDDKRWTVPLTLRLRYYVAGRLRTGPAPPLAASMPGTFVPPGS